MSVAVGLISIVIGLVYLGLGILAVHEVMAERSQLGVSRFGLGFALMAASCGPHHLVHGAQALQGHGGGVESAAVALIGLPGGLVFVWLRIEAATGRRGDRFVAGTPAWVLAAPVVFATAAGAITTSTLVRHGAHLRPASIALWANAFVAITYSMVGWLLLRTQVRRRPEVGGWSLSGLALGAIFPTCALMHLAFGLAHTPSITVTVIDLIGVPASIYFLWVIRALSRDAIVDWNRRPAAGRPRRAPRPAPWARTSS